MIILVITGIANSEGIILYPSDREVDDMTLQKAIEDNFTSPCRCDINIERNRELETVFINNDYFT